MSPPRRGLLLLPLLLLGLGCAATQTGPAFQVAKGAVFYGDLTNPAHYAVAAPILVSTSDSGGYLLVTMLNGELLKYDAATGKKEPRPFALLRVGVRGTPLFDEANKQLVVGAYDKRVHSLDAVSGLPRWQAPVDGNVQASPVLAGPTIVVGTARGTVYGLSPVDGSTLWRQELGAPIWGKAGAHPDWPNRALVGTDAGRLVVLNATDGAILSDETLTGGLHVGPAVAPYGTEMMAYIPLSTGELIGKSLTGTARWSASLDGAEIWATPAVTPEAVYAVSNASKVYALHPQTGNPIWSTELTPKDRLHATPLAIGDRLIVGSLNHTLYALNRSDGKELWKFLSYGEFRARPLPVGNALVALSNDHFLYGLDWKTGKPLDGSVTPDPLPPVLDLTAASTAAAVATPAEIAAELTLVLGQVFEAVQSKRAEQLPGLFIEGDPLKAQIEAAAILERFGEYTLVQSTLLEVIPQTPSDVVAQVEWVAQRGETLVKIVMPLHYQKDASRDPAWRLNANTLSPTTVIEIPSLQP